MPSKDKNNKFALKNQRVKNLHFYNITNNSGDQHIMSPLLYSLPKFALY